jgi:hypothetical protein
MLGAATSLLGASKVVVLWTALATLPATTALGASRVVVPLALATLPATMARTWLLLQVSTLSTISGSLFWHLT